MELPFNESNTYRNLTCSDMKTTNREFEDVSFIGCDFTKAIFLSCKFIDCIFLNCNLSMSKLSDCQLNDVSFKECKLLGLNFSDCISLPFILKFDSCILDYCSFTKKKLLKTSFINSSIKNVDFTECDLTKSIFSGSDLLNAIFFKSILKEVDFVSASNYVIDPELNSIKKAKFSLDGVYGLLNKYDIRIE